MQQIKDNTTSGQQCCIPTKENLADGALRELNAAQKNSDDCWFQGPPFLRQDMKFWSSGDVNAELPNDNLELKKDFISCSTFLSEDVITSVENRLLSWLKLKRVIALVLLYKRKLLRSVKTKKESSPEIHRKCRKKGGTLERYFGNCLA